jgi:hypothetical protein
MPEVLQVPFAPVFDRRIERKEEHSAVSLQCIDSACWPGEVTGLVVARSRRQRSLSVTRRRGMPTYGKFYQLRCLQ